MKRWLVLMGILGGASVGVVILAALAPDYQYSRVRLGMRENEVVEIFRTEPDDSNVFDPPEFVSSGGQRFAAMKQCWWRRYGTTIGVTFDVDGRVAHKFIDTQLGRKGEPDAWLQPTNCP